MVSSYSVSFTAYKTHTTNFIRNQLLSQDKNSVPIIQSKRLNVICCILVYTNIYIYIFKNLLQSSLLTSGILYNRLQRLTIPDAVITQFVLLKMGILYSRLQRVTIPDALIIKFVLLKMGIMYSHLQRLTIPDAVIIQFFLLKMGMLMLETCRGL